MKKTSLSFFSKVVAGLASLCLALQAQAAVKTFQQGLNGYTGTSDTEIREQNPDLNSAEATSLGIDADDPAPFDAQSLIKFDNIIGAGVDQIPPGDTINSAILRVYTQNPGTANPAAYRMLVSWDEGTATWNTFMSDPGLLGGVQQDDVESNLAPDGTFPNANVDETFTEIDVTATVNAWVNGSLVNNGWVIVPAGGDGWDLDSSESANAARRPQLIVDHGLAEPPSFTTQPTDATVTQCRNTSFTVVVQGSLPIGIEWWKEEPVGSANFVLVDSSLNPTATNATLVITNAQLTDATTYFARATNPAGVADSDHVTLTVNADGDGPVAVSALVSVGRTQVTISYNEPVLAWDMVGDVSTTAQDPFDYSIREVGNPANFLVVQQAPPPAIQNRTNIILTLDPGFPWVEGISYEVEIFPDIPDECTGVRSAGQVIAISAPKSFRNDLNSYTGTEDVELREDTGGSAGAEAASVTVDGADPQDAQGLLQFRNFVGSDPNQIPGGSIINNATLRIVQNNPGNIINVHRMLLPWDEATATWNGFTAGVQPDGVEAATAIDFTIPAFAPDGAQTYNVTAAVQAWVNDPSSNHGWALLPTGDDGFDMDSSEALDVTTRPTLTIDYTEVIAPVGIQTQPPPTITINEGDTLTISCIVTGSSPVIQWTRNDVAIPGATSATYTKTNANPNDDGTYRLTADNDFGPPVTSNPSVVTVTPDTTAPTLLSAAASPDMTTIVLTFSETMGASAASTASYSFAPPLTVSSATPSGTNQIILTTSARTFRQSYALTITGVRDDAVGGGGNLLNPNPTIVTIRSDTQRIAGFHDNWHYNTNCHDFTGWETTAFDPVLNGWAEGPGSFGVETSAGTQTLLASEGAQIQTALLDPSPEGLATYFRRSITVPSLDMSGGAVFVVRHFADDGIVFFVDGTEAFRTVNMTNFPMSCLNLASDTPEGGDANLIEDTIALTPGGTHVLAAQVQQNSGTSSDVVFGAEILAVLPQPTMTITYDGTANTVTVSWTPAGGQLEESADLVNWANSSRANGIPAPPTGGNLFYRVRQ